jgi:hypothetical protein
MGSSCSRRLTCMCKMNKPASLILPMESHIFYKYNKSLNNDMGTVTIKFTVGHIP